ncbi:MAG: hypothetical protein IPP22_15240 [Nitrosomonas sp.]|nr:hypothetical protein [Nitrosomonas sp.]
MSPGPCLKEVIASVDSDVVFEVNEIDARKVAADNICSKRGALNTRPA